MSFLESKQESSIENKGTNDWIDDPKETLLIYGNPKTGKTWSYMSIIEDKISGGSDIYILNTDGGVAKTLLQYFGDKSKDIRSKLHYYFLKDMKDVFETIDIVKKVIKKKDVLIFDLMSDSWNFAQNSFIEELAGESIIGFIQRASRDQSKFGVFSAMQWQYIKKLETYVISNLIISPPCSMVIGICSSKDVQIEKAMSKMKKHQYDLAGQRPAGSPDLAYNFNTIVYIGLMEGKRFFMIMGDRGTSIPPQMVTYERNFWNKFQEIRKKEY